MNVLHALPPTAFVSLGVRKEGKCKNRHLGCVNPASWLLLVAGAELTQPSLCLFLQVCILRAKRTWSKVALVAALITQPSNTFFFASGVLTEQKVHCVQFNFPLSWCSKSLMYLSILHARPVLALLLMRNSLNARGTAIRVWRSGGIVGRRGRR